MRRYVTLTPDDIEKYRRRSEMAINGIDLLLQELPKLLECNTIEGKYAKIASYLGLTDDGDSRYNYFVPLNRNIVFLLRLSNHNNANEELYNKFEQMGRPDARYIIYFHGKEHITSSHSFWLESQHNVIPYPVCAFDTHEDIKTFLVALKRLFTDGITRFPNLPQEQTTKQRSQTTSGNQKPNRIKLTEKELKRIVRESIKRILSGTL